MYNKEAFSLPGLGRYFDLYFLNNSYAKAVRQRKDKMVKAIVDVINTSKSSNINIVNLACGSCREVREILAQKSIRYDGKINFKLVDQDQEALDFSKRALDAFRKNNVYFSYFQENILKLFDSFHYQKLWSEQDLIYSTGLIDYVPDRALKKMISFCLNLLHPKGKLILTHKDKNRDPFAPLPPSWFCNWEFVPRNEQDVINLMHSVDANLAIKTYLEDSGRIVFFEITKTRP